MRERGIGLALIDADAQLLDGDAVTVVRSGSARWRPRSSDPRCGRRGWRRSKCPTTCRTPRTSWPRCWASSGSRRSTSSSPPSPRRCASAGGSQLADGSPEPDVLARLESLGEANRARADRLVCFAGGGAYDHEVPPVVRALAGRSEFVTSYTPYQPEVAQGCLQAVFEFQTMVARLAGLPVANASLYDGANALVEAVNLGVAGFGTARPCGSRRGSSRTGAPCSGPSPPAPVTCWSMSRSRTA